MNRVLRWPHTPLYPGMLKPLKEGRHVTVVAEDGCVRFDLPRGPVAMRFMSDDQELAAGTRVYVWWKHAGFVCAPVGELRAEEYRSSQIAERVNAHRARLEAARREREQRESSPMPFDALPVAVADRPLLIGGT